MADNKHYVVDEVQKAALEHQHAAVQESIEKLLEEQRKTVKAVQKLVDYELEQANKLYFNDSMFAIDEFLTKHKLSAACRDLLQKVRTETPKGEVFVLEGKSFIRTYNDMIFSTRDYIKSLELTIAEQVQYKEVTYKVYKTTKKEISWETKKKPIINLIKHKLLVLWYRKLPLRNWVLKLLQ